MSQWSRYVSLGGPNDRDVRPPPRRGPLAWVAAAIVLALVVAFLVVNRTDDVPVERPPTDTTVPVPAAP